MARPTPKCILDRSRACNGCVADSPATCPYPYILGIGEVDDSDDD